MKSARTYVTLTGRSLAGNTLTWMQELVTEFGDDEVSEALEEHSLDVPADKLLGKVRDALARDRLIARKMLPQRELSRDDFMAWVRGERTPILPVIFDAISYRLSEDEWKDVAGWAVARHHGGVMP